MRIANKMNFVEEITFLDYWLLILNIFNQILDKINKKP